jgi:hypothetical protein
LGGEIHSPPLFFVKGAIRVIEFERVLTAFKTLGDSSAQDMNYGRTICEMAISGLECRLRPGAYTAENRDRICFAAAADAFYKHCVVDTASNAAGFKAGDVTASAPDADCVAMAAKIRDDAFDSIADLLIGGGFAFEAV